jgi:lysophospholipase L1-like esterase
MKNDWGNLNRYKSENEKPGPKKPGEQRVVFMGNSITEGWSSVYPEFFSGKPYINRGISGQTTPQMLLRFRQDVINLNPDVVVILAGINDIAGNTGPSTLEMIEDNITSMVELADASKIKVILCSVLPAYDFPWNPGTYPAGRILALNQWIRKYASEYAIPYVDYYSHMADNRPGLMPAYSEDGVHPNKAGYEVMAPLVEKEILRVRERK